MLIVYWPIFDNYFTEVHTSHHNYPRAAVAASSIVVGDDEPSMCLWFVPGTIQED